MSFKSGKQTLNRIYKNRGMIEGFEDMDAKKYFDLIKSNHWAFTFDGFDAMHVKKGNARYQITTLRHIADLRDIQIKYYETGYIPKSLEITCKKRGMFLEIEIKGLYI